jgi:hypothetical protein
MSAIYEAHDLLSHSFPKDSHPNITMSLFIKQTMEAGTEAHGETATCRYCKIGVVQTCRPRTRDPCCTIFARLKVLTWNHWRLNISNEFWLASFEKHWEVLRMTSSWMMSMIASQFMNEKYHSCFPELEFVSRFRPLSLSPGGTHLSGNCFEISI